MLHTQTNTHPNRQSEREEEERERMWGKWIEKAKRRRPISAAMAMVMVATDATGAGDIGRLAGGWLRQRQQHLLLPGQEMGSLYQSKGINNTASSVAFRRKCGSNSLNLIIDFDGIKPTDKHDHLWFDVDRVYFRTKMSTNCHTCGIKRNKLWYLWMHFGHHRS